MTLDQAYEAINGMPYSLGGIPGKLSVERINGMTEVIHNPTPAGRRTKAYRKVKAELKDDFTTTITNSGAMADIFAKVWRDD